MLATTEAAIPLREAGTGEALVGCGCVGCVGCCGALPFAAGAAGGGAYVLGPAMCVVSVLDLCVLVLVRHWLVVLVLVVCAAVVVRCYLLLVVVHACQGLRCLCVCECVLSISTVLPAGFTCAHVGAEQTDNRLCFACICALTCSRKQRRRSRHSTASCWLTCA